MSSRPANETQVHEVLSSLRRSGAVEEGFPARRRATECDAAVGVAISEDPEDKRPPKLQERRSCCWILLSLWGAFVIFVVVSFCFQVKIHRILFPSFDDALERRLARDESIKDVLSFGIWDSERQLTKLQLQVALSMALGVRAEDDDISVESEENFFFLVRVEHATIEEMEFVGSETFIERLNTQLGHYNGNAVLSHPPKLNKVEAIATKR
jgi:hypothetical protein